MRRRFLITTGLFALAAFAFWWSAWRPGFIDADAINRLSRLRQFDLTTEDPALYTVILWIISIGGRSAALATLLQGVAWAMIASVWAGRLTHLGAARWVVAILVGLLSLLPALAVGLLSIWPESILTLASAWLLTELAAKPVHALRLGAALGLVAAMGTVGLVAAIVVGVVLAFGEQAPARSIMRPLLVTAVAVGAAGWLVLPLGMDRGEATTEALVPVVASALTHHGEDFSKDDRATLAQVAPLDLWKDLYECGDASTLLNDPQFDLGAVPSGRIRSIGLKALAEHPLMAIGQRICSSVTLWAPALPSGDRYYLPAYTVFPNSIGVVRSPLFGSALDVTKAVLIRTQAPDRLQWWWRPALPVAVAGLVYLLLAARKRRASIGASLLVGLLIGTFVVGATPAFRTALPLYAIGWMSATLLPTAKRR